ncbi:MAG: cupin domain-containing protein [Phycisphaeraceae bacterium]
MQRYTLTDRQDHWKVLGASSRSQAAVMTLSAGKSTGGPDNKHAQSDQWIYIIAGSGEATVAGKAVKLGTGDLVLIEAGETHEIRNTGDQPLVTFSIYAPPEY